MGFSPNSWASKVKVTFCLQTAPDALGSYFVGTCDNTTNNVNGLVCRNHLEKTPDIPMQYEGFPAIFHKPIHS